MKLRSKKVLSGSHQESNKRKTNEIDLDQQNGTQTGESGEKERKSMTSRIENNKSKGKSCIFKISTT